MTESNPTRVVTDATIPADDPGWDRPAVLVLDDGTTATLPEATVRDAAVLLRLALELGDWSGGTIDPRRVVSIGPAGDDTTA